MTAAPSNSLDTDRPNGIIAALDTLRRQFEEGATKWPGLSCVFISSLINDDIAANNRVIGPPSIESRLTGVGRPFLRVSHFTGCHRTSTGLPSIRWSIAFDYDESQAPGVTSAIERFRLLAEQAWKITFQLPEHAWQLFQPQELMNSPESLVERMWLGPYRHIVNNDFKVVSATDLDTSNVENPGQYELSGITDQCPELWLVALFNLGWLAPKHSLLAVDRLWWGDDTEYGFRLDETELKQILDEFPQLVKSLKLPIDYFYSKLPDVFLTSIWGIDELKTALVSQTPSSDAQVVESEQHLKNKFNTPEVEKHVRAFKNRVTSPNGLEEWIENHLLTSYLVQSVTGVSGATEQTACEAREYAALLQKRHRYLPRLPRRVKTPVNELQRLRDWCKAATVPFCNRNRVPVKSKHALVFQHSDTNNGNKSQQPQKADSATPNDLITQVVAAELLRCDERTIQRRIDDKTIRGYGAKGRRKVSRAEISGKKDQILERRSRKAN